MKRVWAGVAVAAALVLASCSPAKEDPGPYESNAEAGGKVTVVSYDSLEFAQEMIAEFKEATGFDLEISQVGSGGEMVNQLVLTKDQPLGDVAFGLDNISVYRAVQEGVFADDPGDVPSWATEQQIEGAPGLVPFDQGDVCVNLDHEWFEENGVQEPATFEDLTDPMYKDMLVAMNPASSSPGMAFFVATIAAFGDDWKGYWERLRDNGVKITKGWSDAFGVDYSAGEGAGPRPLMVSYASSPAFSVNDDLTQSSTGALLDTCFHQVEYMGVLNGAQNVEGAKAFVQFMLEKEQQEMISESNYMHPVNPDAKAPEALVKFGMMSPNPHQVDAKTIAQNQQEWLRDWADLMGQ